MTALLWTSLMSEVAEPFCVALTSYLNQHLAQYGRDHIEFLPEADFVQRRQSVLDHGVELAWICGVDYVLNAPEAGWPFKPFVAPCVDNTSKPVYFSEMIVHAESPYQSFEDLRGTTWAYNEKMSWSGYKVVAAYLAESEESGPFFGDKVISGSHRNSLEMVRQKEADTAAIDSTVIAMGQVSEPSLMDGLRIVKRIGPYPMPPFVLSQSCPLPLRNTLESILVHMHKTPAGAELLTHWQVKRFDAVADNDYDDIRSSLRRSNHVEL